MKRSDVHALYRRFVNPDGVDLLETFDYGRHFARAEGCRLFDDEGREYLDLLAGFGVHNIGHNHPRLIEALQKSLGSDAPSMLNIDVPLSQAQLAQRLAARTHESLCRASWANSGAEAVEMAIKTAQAATGRGHMLSCHNAYHGLTTGALALMDDPGHRKPFPRLACDSTQVHFGDVAALKEACETLKPAAFFVEPIQGEGGIQIPGADYLAECAKVCRNAGCLLVVDEIQTGFARTGQWFSTDFAAVQPDMLLLGKALSGGIVPSAACMMTEPVWKRAFGSPSRCHLNASTFAGGHLAMTAGLAVMDILEADSLCERAATMGKILGDRLRALAGKHEMIRDVRGRGLLFGIEFAPATGILMKAVPVWAREGLYAQVVSALLLRDHGMVAQPCSVCQNVLRIEPPLCIGERDIEKSCEALDAVLRAVPNHAAALKRAVKRSIFHGEL